MAYAGRLDPMASGKLLVLLGDECKNQTQYHGLDKEYQFSVLLGIGSDSHDVLGRLYTNLTQETELSATKTVAASRDTPRIPPTLSENLVAATKMFTGNIELPYPHFSAKTVQGKPLHMWTLEGRLDEIVIPTKKSTVYSLHLDSIETTSRERLCAEARNKIDSIPEVTDARKALGNDFRRADVRQDWEDICADDSLPNFYHIAHFTCVASSGTYMRTLAHFIGVQLNTPALAWSIHRTEIGNFNPTTLTWEKKFSSKSVSGHSSSKPKF